MGEAAMSTRILSGTVRHSDGTAWGHATLRVQKLALGTQLGEVYPMDGFNVTADANGVLPETALAVPETGAWLRRITFPDTTEIDFYLAAGAPISIDEIVALAEEAGSEAGTPQGEFLNGLYTAVSGADDGQMLQTESGDLILIDTPQGMPEPGSDGLWARFVASAVGSWLQATTVGAALFAAVDAAAGRAALGAAASAGSGTAGELMVSDADGNSVRAGYTASQSASANTVARRTSDGGIAAIGNNSAGVDGRSISGAGVYGESAAASGSGVSGYSPTTGTGITGISASGSGGQSTSVAGTYHHRFGVKSAIDRVSGILKFVDSTAASDRAAQRAELGLGSAALLTPGATGTSLVEAASVDAARAVLDFPSLTMPPRVVDLSQFTWSTSDIVGSGGGANNVNSCLEIYSGVTANSTARLRINNNAGMYSRSTQAFSWSKRLDIATYTKIHSANSEGIFRFFAGKNTTDALGAVASGNYIGYTVANGTITHGYVCKVGVLTTVALTNTAINNAVVFMTSKNGTVSWYVNGVLIGTTSAGPTGDNQFGTLILEIANGVTGAAYTVRQTGTLYSY